MATAGTVVDGMATVGAVDGGMASARAVEEMATADDIATVVELPRISTRPPVFLIGF